MALKIIRNDITKMKVDAVVNTANSEPIVGDGCDTAIYNAAGRENLLAMRKRIGHIDEGEADITPGFKLPAKYIIHAVSPLYIEGDDTVEEKLRNCYRNSLRIAKEKGLHSIAFPLISTGSFGYPKEEGLRVAVDEINAFLLKNMMDITIVVFDKKSVSLGKRIDPNLESQIDNAELSRVAEEEYAHSSDAVKPDVSDDTEEVPGNVDTTPKIQDEDDEGILLEKYLKEKGADSFSQKLAQIIKSKGFSNPEVYKRAVVDKKVFSKINNDPTYSPSKMTAMQLCVGAQLTIDQTKDLLRRAGYALSPANITDLIFAFFIENGIYDMLEIDIRIEEHGQKCIIS